MLEELELLEELLEPAELELLELLLEELVVLPLHAAAPGALPLINSKSIFARPALLVASSLTLCQPADKLMSIRSLRFQVVHALVVGKLTLATATPSTISCALRSVLPPLA